MTNPSSAWFRRAAGALAVGAMTLSLLVLACDDAIEPAPPKAQNRAPETFLLVNSDSLAAQLYKVPLSWLGSDPDGRVAGFQYRWTCLDQGLAKCPPPPGWTPTVGTRDTFTLYVPQGNARYRFEVAAIDDQGLADPTPETQEFTLRNTPPVAAFEAGTTPTRTLPAVTFYIAAVDPDTTSSPDDDDTGAGVALYRAWLDDAEDQARYVPASPDGVTFAPEDFAGRYGLRTVFVQTLDDGGAVGNTIAHSWTVDTPPADGILLVDDCRMGQFLETRSDQSYRDALAAVAPGRSVVLDVETIPRLSRADLEATLSLFEHVVWYTDADTVSSGALELARGGLDLLLGRAGHLLLVSSVAFGTRGAFGVDEPRFRDLFGITDVFRAPNGGTNFALSQTDTVHAAVTPGLTRFRFLSLGLRAVMECFGSRQDAETQSLYFYPESTFVRATADTIPFVNPVQFDIGVHHQLPAGGRTIYVSFPLGLPINDNMGESEAEIRELLRLAGMVGP